MIDDKNDIPIPPATGLFSWLDVATRGLGNLAKERIAEEIGAHHREAYEAALDDGVPTIEAEQRAIASLGNPKKARRGFRKVYLTRREEKSVQELVKTAYNLTWSRNVNILGGLCLYVLSIYNYVIGDLEGAIGLSRVLLFSTWFMLNGLVLSVQSRLLQQRRVRRALVWQIAPLAFLGWLSVLLFLPTDFAKIVIPVIVYIVSIGLIVGIVIPGNIRALRKLPHVLTESEWEIIQRKTDLRDAFIGRWRRW